MRKILGFSLVELMVVLAIIALMTMTFLPSINRMREHSRSTSCMANLREYSNAMARYMSEWKGYFIYFGDSGIAAPYAAEPDSYDKDTYKLLRGHTEQAVGSSRTWDWDDFITAYIKDTVTLKTLSMGKPSVRICPAVLQQLRRGNFFDPKSPSFKGYHEGDDYDATRQIADFEAQYTPDGELILANYFTTYAINNYPGVYGADRKNISPNTVAFIDWNAREGWWATLRPSGANVWQFTSPDKSKVQGIAKWSQSWWLTEVGFHHRDGTNIYANYAALDGHVSQVTSNQITENYFMPSGPQ